jgi:tRNA(Ile)-lysidine synthase
VHAITSSWRRLTGGKSIRDADRRTLIACSGGADSSALVLALAHQSGSVAVAHVVHDMRNPSESAKCFTAAKTLADSLGLPFASAEVAAKAVGGNYESAARTLRYAALQRLATEHGCRYIATAHHAEDQLETILLRLLRGAGSKGFAAIRARRKLPSGLSIIRPMLSLSRDQARALCTESNWHWSEDATNADVSHRRAALRANVLPNLLAIDPQAAFKAADSARLALLTADHLDRAARTLATSAATTDPNTFDRTQLRTADRIILLTWLRSLDPQTPLRTLESIARAIGSTSGEPREWAVGECTIALTKNQVHITRNRKPNSASSQLRSSDPPPARGVTPA